MEPIETEGPLTVPPEGVDRESFTVAYLAAHEAECPACGYNVHKLTQARCPECGRPLEVQVVGVLAGFTWAWMVSLVVLGLAAGVGVLVVAVVVHEGMHGAGGLRTVLIYFMDTVAGLPGNLREVPAICRQDPANTGDSRQPS